ncbi:MAG: ferredoxin [Burkholderiales bacterium]|nr:ferredoxin [Burkholderiales bacterium]
MAKIKRSFTVEISEARCRSCAVCWEICEPKVLGWKPPLNKAIIKDIEACTGCRLCEWLCPDWAIVVKPAALEPGGTRAEELSEAAS